MEYQKADGSKSGTLEKTEEIDGFRSSVEPYQEIQKVRVEHPASRAVLLGFMGPPEAVAIRMERVLFMNLAQEIRKEKTPAAFIQKIDVPERWQNQGIGSTLMLEFFRVVQGAGIQRIYLDACPASEDRLEDLVNFYERLGFIEIAECGEEQFPPPFIMKSDLGNWKNA